MSDSAFSEISSPDNEKIKLYRKLSADKKIRRRENMFVIEGARLVADAVKEAAELYCVFITPAAAEKYDGTLALISENVSENRVFIISDALAKLLSDTDMPQGFFAICRSRVLDKSSLYGTIKSGGAYLVIDNVQDPGNLGTILRTADACGIDAVFTCSCCDIYNPKTVRSTMGSLFRLTVIAVGIGEAAAALKSAGVTLYAAVIDKSAVSLTECDFSAGGAVMIGNEGNGLPQEHIDLADIPVTIRMSGRVNSLNAAMAAGIIMWELKGRRQSL